MMWVKICGNTRLEDCLLAADLGANAVGFVLAAGKRTVTAPQVAAITAKLPPELEKFGVFTTLDANEIIAAVEAAGLTGVQLHTDAPSFELLSTLRGYFGAEARGTIIQVANRWADLSEEEQGQSFASTVDAVVREGSADALLIDSKTRGGSGGTGRTFDWQAAKPALTGLSLPVIVAGGLRPENVAEAVATLRPWGVDVSSGVEDAPGVKNADRMRSFIQNARQA